MPATLAEVKDIILQEFPGANVTGLKEENYRILGPMWWDGFADMDIVKRNHLITERVRNKLGLTGMNIGVIFPLEPGEDL